MPQDAPDLLNFRDVGDLLRSRGFAMRPGMLFRSGLLAWPDQSRLNAILGGGEALMIDLRSPNERRQVPGLERERTGGGLIHFASDIEETAPHLFSPEATPTEEGIRAYYISRYMAMATGRDFERLFGRALCLLASTSGPAFVHCSAGKDRTGLLIALALSAMDVPFHLIELDYMASNGAPGLELSVHAAMSRLAAGLEEQQRSAMAAALSKAYLDYLAAAFEAIREKHGSVSAYFDAVGLDDELRIAMKRRFLE